MSQESTTSMSAISPKPERSDTQASIKGKKVSADKLDGHACQDSHSASDTAFEIPIGAVEDYELLREWFRKNIPTIWEPLSLVWKATNESGWVDQDKWSFSEDIVREQWERLLNDISDEKLREALKHKANHEGLPWKVFTQEQRDIWEHDLRLIAVTSGIDYITAEKAVSYKEGLGKFKEDWEKTEKEIRKVTVQRLPEVSKVHHLLVVVVQAREREKLDGKQKAEKLRQMQNAGSRLV